MQLVKDRAALSDRAALYTRRANEAARLLRLWLDHVSVFDVQDEIRAWLEPCPPNPPIAPRPSAENTERCGHCGLYAVACDGGCEGRT